jgi:hypothetical protein
MTAEDTPTRIGPTQKTCERCGEAFGCAAPQRSCWCDEVKLSAETLAELKSRYADCLCPHCLAVAAEGERLSP